MQAHSIRYLFRLTSGGNYELEVEMWDHDGIYAVARYKKFKYERNYILPIARHF